MVDFENIKVVDGPSLVLPFTSLICDSFDEWVMYLILSDHFADNGSHSMLLVFKDGTSKMLYSVDGRFFKYLGKQSTFDKLRGMGMRWVYLYNILFYKMNRGIIGDSFDPFDCLESNGVLNSKAQMYYKVMFTGNGDSMLQMFDENNIEYIGDSREYRGPNNLAQFDKYKLTELSGTLPDGCNWSLLNDHILDINCSIVSLDKDHIQYKISGNNLETTLYAKRAT